MNNREEYEDHPDAVYAEKLFNGKNVLLLTFHEKEPTYNSIKKLHLGIKNVHILQPLYVPKWRCVVEIQDKCNVELIRAMLTKKAFGSGYITADYVKKIEETGRNINPCTLYVRNLPKNLNARDIAILFPLCKQYQFIPCSSNNTKSALILFSSVKDAVMAYKCTNNILYHSHVLMVQFYRTSMELNESLFEEEIIDCDEEDIASEVNEDDLDNENPQEDILFTDDVYFNEDEEDETDDASEQISNVTTCKQREGSSSDEGGISNNASEQDTENKSVNKEKKTDFPTQGTSKDSENQKNVDIEVVLKSLRPSELKEENIKNKNFDPYTLYVSNLPTTVDAGDILKLFPSLKGYEFMNLPGGFDIVKIRFSNVEESLKVYKNSNDLIFKKKKLIVRFDNSQFSNNEEALKKRKLPYSDTSCVKKNALDSSNSSDDDDVVIVSCSTMDSNTELKEDDVDYDSEEDDYINNVILRENDYVFMADNDEFQDLELDENDTFLPDDDNDEAD